MTFWTRESTTYRKEKHMTVISNLIQNRSVSANRHRPRPPITALCALLLSLSATGAAPTVATDFDYSVDGTVYAITEVSGGIVIGGSFTAIGGAPKTNIA